MTRAVQDGAHHATRRARRLFALSRFLVPIAIIAVSVVNLESTSASTPPPGFSSSASAFAVLIDATLPGAPLTSTPLDSGGPSGQASLNSLGSGTGYAAFPDPGSFIESLPGLGAGLLSTGAAGLPPIKLPPVPDYPFEVTANATKPQDSVGAGAYRISAFTNQNESQGTALTGLQISGAGNTALVTSTSDIKVHGDGSVVATAVSDVQGLTLGPVNIGEIKSTATETLTADGTVTPASSITINAVRIGTLPITVSTNGLNIAGNAVPLPIGGVINKLLKASGITVDTITAQKFKGRIVSPALRITGPLPTKGIGTANGTYTVTLGSATAAITASVPSTGTTGPIGGSGTLPGTGSTGGTGTVGSTGGTGSLGGTGAVPPIAPGTGTVQPQTSPPAVAPPSNPNTGALKPAAYLGTFDIRDLYLLLCIVGAGAFLMAQLVRLIGVRGPWTSTNG
jgi:hypothetical protein